MRNVETPSFSRKGKSTVRKTDGTAGTGRWKKRTLLCNGVDRNGADRARSFYTKVSRLPSGLSGRENLINRERKQSRWRQTHLPRQARMLVQFPTKKWIGIPLIGTQPIKTCVGSRCVSS